MNRFWKRVGGWAGIVALVFAQLAVSAYACPAAPAEAMPAVAPCHQADQDNANLCQKHCHDSQQSQHASPVVSDAFVPGFVATVDLPPIGASSASAGEPALLHATSPPASIRNCCLRI
jgi:hypothetical protein